MAGAMEDLILRIKSIFDPSGVNELKKHVNKTRAEMAKLDSAAETIQKSVGGSYKKIRKEVGDAARDMKRFRMEYLGIMFFGMAIQRLFMGILKASFQTWSAVTEGTNQAGGAMGQLNAATEFFKYSLFEALQNSGLFQYIVDVVLRLVNWFSSLSDKTRSWVANLVLIGVVIGTILFVFGTLVLGMNSMSMFLVGHNVAWSGILGLMKDAYKWIMTKLIPGVTKLGAVLMASPVFWVALMVAGIILIGGYIVWLTHKMGGIGEFFKSVGAGLIRVAAVVAEGFSDTIGGAIDWLLEKLISMLSWLHKSAQAFDTMFGTKVASKFQTAITGLESLKNAMFLLRESDVYLRSGEALIDKFGLRPSATGQEESLGFGDYLSDMFNKLTNAISGGRQGGPTGPQEVVIKNADEVGRSLAQNVPAPASAAAPNNLFSDELNRQGYGYLMGA